MAYKHEVVENKIAVRYHGVTVYHTHKEDDFFNSPNKYLFSTNPFGSEKDGETFDIRKLGTYDSKMSTEQNLLRAIDAELLGETNTKMREGGMIESVNIDQGADECRCPVCQTVLLSSDGEESVWRSSGLTDDGTHYEYECQCPQCKATFKQVYRLEFEGYDID